jgi:hypothetical protein
MSTIQSQVVPEPTPRTAGPSCSHCRCELAGTEKFCPGCATPLAIASQPLPAKSIPEASTASPGPASESGTSVKACDPVPATPTNVTAAPPSASNAVACAKCSQVLPPDAQYCMRCGHPLAPPQPAFHVCRSGAGQRPEERKKIEKEIVIGKASECDLVIASDEYVSRQHARISLVDGKPHVVDLGSSNGTYLRIRRPTPLEPGDELVIGSGTVRVELL